MSTSETPQTPSTAFLGAEEFNIERIFPIRNLVADNEGQTGGGNGGSSGSDSSAGGHGGAGEGGGRGGGGGPGHARHESVGYFSPRRGSGSKRPEDLDVNWRPASAPVEQSLRIPPPTPDATADGFYPPPYPKIPPEDLLRPLSLMPLSPTRKTHENGNSRRISERSQMVPHIAGAPGVVPGVITGAEPTFYRCEDEPIHIPGAIQQFGALVALRYDNDDNLLVRIASENTENIMFFNPEQLFHLTSFLDILDEEYEDDFVARVGHALTHAADDLLETHLDCFNVVLVTDAGEHIQVWCAIHISKGTHDLIICEFEQYTTPIFHLDGLHSPNTHPAIPTHTIANEVSPEERLKSLTSMSQPLRVLQLARRRQNSALGSMEVFNAMTQVQQQLAAATTVQSVLDMTVGLVSELTGFHRVMLYRFDSHKNGCVVTELVDPKASADLFRGLNFPASDIPKQARDLYMINRIRMLYDRDEETARFLGRDQSDFEKPLDLTHSYLRAMSPIHLKYLINMGVRSTMSISLVINDDLWGLVACHHYGEAGLRVSLPIRELCRNIGECASTNIERLLMLQRIQARKPPLMRVPQQNPSGFIAASSADLVASFDADFGLLSIQGEARAIGRLDPYRESLALLAHLQKRRFTSILGSQNINSDFPALKYAPGINAIAGLLVIPLSLDGADFIVFFRKGQLREVRWAGNPYEKVVKPGSQYLEPRASFRRWTETVGGMSREWTEDQMDTASILSSIYGRFIEIWRQKESAAQNNRLTRLLLRNSSHEVRTPLNAIVNYLEIALETPVEETLKDVLEKAYKASRSLIYVIDDLLNLTKVENERITAPKESFDLGLTVSEVITPFRKEAIRKNLDLTVSTHPGIPEMVKGDPSRLRQIISNILANAFQNSNAGGIKVDIRPLRYKLDSSVIGIRVQDVGNGMSEKQLDELFQEFEQIIDDDEKDSNCSTPASVGSGEKTLGLGLAVVARYVRNMDGQIRVRSELGKGTIFGIELPFEHAPPALIPEHRSLMSPDQASPPKNPASRFRRPSTPGQTIYQTRGQSLARRRSLGADVYIPDLISEGSELSSVSHGSVAGLDSQGSTPSEGCYGEGASEEKPAGFRQRTQSGRTVNFSNADMPLVTLPDPLSVLIAEDNPINARLLSRRLLKLGHRVEVADDGQVCHDLYSAKGAGGFDVILMDLQMPLVDGHLATKMVRLLERSTEDPTRNRVRIPIIAVSASLLEECRFDYIECGFDGWLMKPVDFSRLDFLLRGIRDIDLRRRAQYTPGQWEQGGWFLP